MTAVGAIVPSSKISSGLPGKPHAARGVPAELACLAQVRQFEIPGTIGGGDAPDVRAVAAPVERIADGVGALRQHGAPAVLEVVESQRPHEFVLDAAEVDPDRAELMAEHRPEGEVGLSFERAPASIVVGRPRHPGLARPRERSASRAPGCTPAWLRCSRASRGSGTVPRGSRPCGCRARVRSTRASSRADTARRRACGSAPRQRCPGRSSRRRTTRRP